MSTNRLGSESSPYLRQHAENPVHWQPWDEAALAQARSQNRPILLSIGYSACHWCHVMAHESFEDPDTAALMNKLFVNIKVDREERPDLDQVYQTLHQVVNRGGGGWPLTVFLDPATHIPFFSGTYFPPGPAHGLPAFRELLQRLSEFFQTQPEEIQQHNGKLKPLLPLLEGQNPNSGQDVDKDLPEQAEANLRRAWDRRMGGFSGAPKFPMPAALEFMLSRPAGRAACLHSLQMMARGGIHDHVGGGFYRYAVDGDWMIPHFEKMLYDNGALLALYSKAAFLTRDPDLTRAARKIVHWAQHELGNGQGAYHAALDADSEGEEGLYYLWTPEEVRALLSGVQGQLLCETYGLDGPANFEGRWHLWVGHGCGLPEHLSQEDLLLTQALDKLARVRRQRIAPGCDDKVLCSWNAMMARGLAIAGRLLDEPDMTDAAGACIGFLRSSLWDGQRLKASWQGGEARFNAYLDDHAFLLQAVLELLQARWSDELYEFAQALAESMLEHFPARDGGFHVTSDDHETLLFRPVDRQDDALPSGNGVAAHSLLVLAQLAGQPRYAQAACATIDAAAEDMQRAPEAHCALMLAQAERTSPAPMVLLRAGEDWLEHCQEWRLNARIYRIDSEQQGPPALQTPNPPPAPWALFCGDGACRPPARSISELTELLRETVPI